MYVQNLSKLYFKTGQNDKTPKEVGDIAIELETDLLWCLDPSRRFRSRYRTPDRIPAKPFCWEEYCFNEI